MLFQAMNLQATAAKGGQNSVNRVAISGNQSSVSALRPAPIISVPAVKSSQPHNNFNQSTESQKQTAVPVTTAPITSKWNFILVFNFFSYGNEPTIYIVAWFPF